MTQVGLFSYGSLVDPASAAETLGRPVAPQPAELRGWARRWTLARDNRTAEKRFELPDGTRPDHCLALNLEPDAAALPPNGALLELSEAEAERLDGRELRYRRIEVTDGVTRTDGSSHGLDVVFAYCARPENHLPEPGPGAVVIAAYLRTVERAFTALGTGQLERFRSSTAAPPVPVSEAVLVHDSIRIGNPRAW